MTHRPLTGTEIILHDLIAELKTENDSLRAEVERLRTALATADEMAPSHTNITRAAE